MNEQSDKPKNGSVAVPVWVGIVTYLICWSLGGYLLVAESRGGTAHVSLLVVGVLLILFPSLSFQGLVPVLVKGIGKRLGGNGG